MSTVRCHRIRPVLRSRQSNTRPVLSGKAVDNIKNSVLDELVVTDTIPLDEAAAACPRIRQLSIAELLAETMRRISNEESVSSLFMD